MTMTAMKIISSLILALISTTPIIATDPSCPEGHAIDCRHQGYCRVGEKNYDSFLFLPVSARDHVLNKHLKDDNGHYCDCIENNYHTIAPHWTGLTCETEYNFCTDGTLCFNGAPCLRDYDDQNKFVCGCPFVTVLDEENPRKFAGKHCEFESTSFCDYFEETDDGYMIPEGEWFCTNGGECRATEEDPQDRCSCPDGFYGLHCELINDEACLMSCQNDGVCKHGTKDYSNEVPDSLVDYFKKFEGMTQHCICKKGWTGPLCEIEINSCGHGHCLHGSQCAIGTNEIGASFSYCRCENAEEESEEGLNYAGEYCENAHTVMCPYPDGFDPQDYFCVNDGECPDEPHQPCKCDGNHAGPRCEFEVIEEKTCSLDCFNGGTCFFGNEVSTPYGDYDLSHIVSPGNPNDNMHCKCPDGYTGEFCEKRINICGKDEHMCLHGAPCVDVGLEFECDCEAASTDTMTYVGRSCEFAATSFCQGDHAGKHSFCANHGKCTGTVDREGMHPGCDCEEGFHGDYCEIYGDHNETNGIAGRLFIGFSLTLFIVAAIAGTFLYRKKFGDGVDRSYSQSGLDQNMGDNTYSMGPDGAAGGNNGVEGDEEDYELKDVSII